MSQPGKPARGSSSQAALYAMSPVDVPPNERQRVVQLIAVNKSGPALDLAKDIHKRLNCAASEALLLDTYGARVKSLTERNLDPQAKALIDLVRERYPAASERVREWNAAFAAHRGDPSALVQPLNDPSLPAERQAAIAASVRQDVFDLRALAGCQSLSSEHPLRAAATALHRALEAVTSGPVPDEALALAEVSRSSPLSPWKMMIRAIAAYYRRDDGMAEKYLSAVEPHSAAARLVPALLAMLHQTPAVSPTAAALAIQVGGNVDHLRSILKALDAALDRGNQNAILQEIEKAISACRQTEPELLERLKQHISIRAMLAELKAEKVAAAMNGPSLKNAYFWRLLARTHEETKDNQMAIAYACSCWEEFRKHAIREGWFPGQGPEVAAVYHHMADQLCQYDREDLNHVRAAFQRHFDFHEQYYRGQPPEIRGLMPARPNRNLYFLSPSEVLQRACEADPISENFQRWLQFEEKRTSDIVAERWSAALPNDIPPLLHLMQSAEKRNALQKAFKLMEQAEKIDGVNAEVRRARLRLLVSIARRHLREKKPHLAEKELCQIEALPQAQQGDRPAFLAALRFVWCLLRNSRQEADTAFADAERLLGDGVTAYLLVLQVEQWCGRRSSALGQPSLPTVPLFAAFGRVCALADDFGMTVHLTDGMPQQMMRELSAPNVSADARPLAALGEAAIRQQHYPFAYVISRAGLHQGADSRARFLFLRARSLPPWEEERRSACLAAATELARHNHDSDLLRRIGEWRAESSDWLDVAGPAPSKLGPDEILRVVQREIEQSEFPTSRPDLSDDDVLADGECPCPACRAQRGELPPGPGELPPGSGELPPELIDLMERLGPQAVAQIMAEMLGGGGKKKRGRRRSILDDLDIPF